MKYSSCENPHRRCHPFLNVFSTTTQTIPSRRAVSFTDFAEICGFELICPKVLRATDGGVFQFYYYLLPIIGPSQDQVSSAFAIRVNDIIQPQTRSGTGFNRVPVKTAGPFVLWGLVTIPYEGKIELVNIDLEPAVLQSDQFSASAATASLTLRKVAD